MTGGSASSGVWVAVFCRCGDFILLEPEQAGALACHCGGAYRKYHPLVHPITSCSTCALVVDVTQRGTS